MVRDDIEFYDSLNPGLQNIYDLHQTIGLDIKLKSYSGELTSALDLIHTAKQTTSLVIKELHDYENLLKEDEKDADGIFILSDSIAANLASLEDITYSLLKKSIKDPLATDNGLLRAIHKERGNTLREPKSNEYYETVGEQNELIRETYTQIQNFIEALNNIYNISPQNSIFELEKKYRNPDRQARMDKLINERNRHMAADEKRGTDLDNQRKEEYKDLNFDNTPPMAEIKKYKDWEGDFCP